MHRSPYSTGAEAEVFMTSHLEPGTPWQNPFVESYNGRLRRELLDLELLDSMLEAQVLVDVWREE
jgi:putative transposase